MKAVQSSRAMLATWLCDRNLASSTITKVRNDKDELFWNILFCCIHCRLAIQSWMLSYVDHMV